MSAGFCSGDARREVSKLSKKRNEKLTRQERTAHRLFQIAPWLSVLLLVVPAAVLTWKAGKDTAAPRKHLAKDALTARTVFALLPLGAVALWAGTLATAAGPNSGGEGTGDMFEKAGVAAE